MNNTGMKTCPNCGMAAEVGARFCAGCGHQYKTDFSVPPDQTQMFGFNSQHPAIRDAAGKKIAAGVCAILLGALGIHKFILGYSGSGIVMLLISVLSCGFLSFIPGIIGIVEGVMYLTKSDEQFYWEYIAAKKEWF